MQVVVLNGANLNAIGDRDPELYGGLSIEVEALQGSHVRETRNRGAHLNPPLVLARHLSFAQQRQRLPQR